MIRSRRLLLYFLCLPVFANSLPTGLHLRGYSVIPAPRQVTLEPRDLDFSSAWTVDATRIPANHIALRSLLGDLKEFHRLDIKAAPARGANVIRLFIAAGTVAAPAGDGIADQAYKLVITPGLVEITGNAGAGLFYGVQTFLQLLKPGPGGTLLMPASTVEDWPSYAQRFLHWDTKHHQDRMETLKRYIDWSARFKANRIGFEIEDKFEFPSHPVIGAPGAFTTAELQELVNYGIERFVQVVPVVQSPAHMAFVLKHPEFAGLRQDGINYQMCTCDPRTYELIFSMYDDLIKATKGVDSFFVSTDGVYYAGKCDKCKAPYNPENSSLEW
ncbi:MAG: beta-N-acetylhexosaminidase, partial [Acidobacteria bacterium]|nr:beta-N-acetylhexosaminidase [Acidobacteriota bacterium]